MGPPDDTLSMQDSLLEIQRQISPLCHLARSESQAAYVQFSSLQGRSGSAYQFSHRLASPSLAL